MTPLVALTATSKQVEERPHVRLNQAYVEAVRQVGLTPLVVPPVDDTDLSSILDAVDGLILTGGEDVDPAEYGAAPAPQTGDPQRARDKCELAMARLAHDRRVPTLAICRGIQVVNVAFGGTLVQDIAAECGTAIEHDLSKQRTQRVHDIVAHPDSSLAHALGGSKLSVNSSHHQAVARVADGLRVTARSSDGIVEGAEWQADDWWMLAVQWHPEELIHTREPWDRALFAEFARRVSRR